jgi:hypothetical protein
MGQGRSVKELSRRTLDPIVAPRRGRPSKMSLVPAYDNPDGGRKDAGRRPRESLGRGLPRWADKRRGGCAASDVRSQRDCGYERACARSGAAFPSPKRATAPASTCPHRRDQQMSAGAGLVQRSRYLTSTVTLGVGSFRGCHRRSTAEYDFSSGCNGQHV